MFVIASVLLAVHIAKSRSYDLSNCFFATEYSLEDLFKSAPLQEEFILQICYWEGKFAADGFGANHQTGLTYRGFGIFESNGRYDYHSVYPYIDPKTGNFTQQNITQPQDEAVHLALLTLAINSNAYALWFFESSLEGSAWKRSVFEFAVEQITKKIGFYEKFKKAYPGFGGYLPSPVEVDDSGFHVLKSYQTDYFAMGTIVNGDAHGLLCWAMIAAVQALRNNGLNATADRYEAYFNGLAASGRLLFDTGHIASSFPPQHIITVINISHAASAVNTKICDHVCSRFVYTQYFDVDLFLTFIYYVSDWSTIGKKAKIAWKSTMMTVNRFGLATYRNSRNETITVRRGIYFSADEQLKYLFLPYFDVPTAEQLYLNGQKARTHFSRDKAFRGLFGAVWAMNGDANYVDQAGIRQLAQTIGNLNKIIATYAAFPLILHTQIRPYGLVWLANVLNVPRMLGCFGITPGINLTDSRISNPLEWIQKTVVVLAFAGGVVNLTREYLENNGQLDEFIRNVADEYASLSTNTKIQGEAASCAIPLGMLANDEKRRYRLHYCDGSVCVDFNTEVVLTAFGAVMVGMVLFLSVFVNRKQQASYKYFTRHIFTVHLLDLVVNLVWIAVSRHGVDFVSGDFVETYICIHVYMQVYLLPMCFISMASVTVLSVLVSIVFPLHYQKLFGSALRWHCYMGGCYVFTVVSTIAGVCDCRTTRIFALEGTAYILGLAVPYILSFSVTLIVSCSQKRVIVQSAFVAGASFFAKAAQNGEAKQSLKVLGALMNYSAVPLLWCVGIQSRQVWNLFSAIAPLDRSDGTYLVMDYMSFWFRVTFGVAHATSTLVVLPPIRRAFMQMIADNRFYHIVAGTVSK